MILSYETPERLKNTIQVLQQLQRLLSISATLSDVTDLLACVEAEYGSEILLEDVIQSLVGEHLAVHCLTRIFLSGLSNALLSCSSLTVQHGLKRVRGL
jgi:hypothetical protein